MLKEVQDTFLKGEIEKQAYIEKMYSRHEILFEYSSFITSTNISNIEITDGRVVMTFRDSEIKFICSEGDRRLAPLDTLNFGSYELEELRIQNILIEGCKTIFDIGGNFGWYALHIAKANPNTTVHCFEPIPSTFAQLLKNIELNDLKNITPYSFGFSDKEEIIEFFFDPSLSVNASMGKLNDSSSLEKISCPVKLLDVFCYEKNLFPDFIKCDVEGAELFVFKGGEKMLTEHHPTIFCEMLRKWTAKLGYHPNDIIQFLKPMGYSCFYISNNKLASISAITDETKETNFIFLHETKHKEKLRNLTSN